MRGFLALPAIVSSVIATVLLLGFARLGVFQTFELRVFDQMMQMRTDSGEDSRLLIVTVTEEDIRRWGHPLSGEVLDNLMGKLIEYEPRAIGLDIFRDLPVEPGHNQLLERLQLDDLIVPICEHSEADKPAIPAPTGIESERVGFNDIVQDSDGIIRRNLLFLDPVDDDLCQAEFSFGLQLALKYLVAEGIQPQFNSKGELQLSNTIFKPLESNFGAYQNIDAGGYQIMLNYRSPKNIAQQVTVTDVLINQISQDLVKNRIVLIGSTAPSLKDIQNTPFSSGKSDNSGDMAGVLIHANSVSQILSTVLNGKSLFWSFSEWGEAGWILLWSLTGSIIAILLRSRHPVFLGITGVGTLAILFGGNFLIFTQAGWLPLITPALGLVLAGGSVIAYSGYQSKQEVEQKKIEMEKIKKEIEKILKEQEQLEEKLKKQLATQSTKTVASNPIGEEIKLNTLLKHRYKIAKVLSEGGGFGRTYLAQDIQRPGNPICVVKQLRPIHQKQNLLDIAKRLFENEAKVLELLGRQHNQIPQLLAYFIEEGQFYLVQEYIQGQTLDKEIIAGKIWQEAQVVELLKEVLQILVFVHSQGVIHRDIKPSNLIRRKSDGCIVLIDFGAVKIIESSPQQNKTITIGTPGYTPNEQFIGQPTLNSDIYALGIVAIQALIGIDPRMYSRDPNTSIIVTQSQLNEAPQYWRNQVKISDKLVAVLDKMVDLNSITRYQSAEEILNSLKEF